MTERRSPPSSRGAPALRRARPSRAPVARDMDASAFAVILSELVGRVPGAFACALVDGLGETVDYAGLVDPFDLKLAAAHLQILLRQLEDIGSLGAPRSLVIRSARRTLVARGLPEGYVLVLLLRRRAGFTASERAFETCERALAVEAGWCERDARARWFPMEIEVDRRGRPRLVRDASDSGEPIRAEVLGSVMGLHPRQRGFRVRLLNGRELTLVREPGRAWYGDDRARSQAPSIPDPSEK